MTPWGEGRGVTTRVVTGVQLGTDLCTVLTEMLKFTLFTSTDRHTSDNLTKYWERGTGLGPSTEGVWPM